MPTSSEWNKSSSSDKLAALRQVKQIGLFINLLYISFKGERSIGDIAYLKLKEL